MKIKKKDSNTILNTLQGGVVPSRGLQYIMVGRKEEAIQIANDLKNVKDGSSVVKFFIGPFGSGKTFLQALIQQAGFNEKFVVTKADFTPDRRLHDSNGKSRNLYNELMKNLAISTVPEGDALSTILEKWINEVQNTVVQEKKYGIVEFDNPQFVEDVEKEINKIVNGMDSLIGGYDFSRIVSLYFKAFIEDDEILRRNALRWLKGEYTTKVEARKDLGVRSIIDDSNYFEYIKVLCQFVKSIGYSGLIVNLDEAINLYKITHLQSREKNYEVILKIYNDTLQGNMEGLYITFGGTLEFLEDERRGLFSYGALKRRLQSNRYETIEFRDLSQPVIKITPLKIQETFVLLEKLKDIHSVHHGYISDVTKDDIQNFLEKEYSRPGAEEHITAGDVIRNFLGALNILLQNPNINKNEIFGEHKKESKNNISSRFHKSE